MFAMIRTIGTENVLPGDPVVLKYDNGFSRIGAYSVGGDAYGFLCENQPAGCVDDWTMYSRIGNRRIIARAAVIWCRSTLRCSRRSKTTFAWRERATVCSLNPLVSGSQKKRRLSWQACA